MTNGEVIQLYRKRSRKTQAELAESLGVHEMTIRRWESGISEPRASDILKLCEVLGVGEAELLNGPESSDVKFSIIWEVNKEMNAMEVKMNEFKIGRGESDDFGMFRFSKDIAVEEIGQQFMNHLRAARAGREVYDKELRKLGGEKTEG
jgi:transcriptional regulator with XRE-family HTH domain